MNARTSRRAWVQRGPLILAIVTLVFSACLERGERWYTSEEPLGCTVGARRCAGAQLEVCREAPGGVSWAVDDDCAARGEVCAPGPLACTRCLPGQGRCDGQVALRCDDNGAEFVEQQTCDTDRGDACREGACENLCARAAERRSNVGCEYWAVDLDNANVSARLNAAAQQFAVVLSNAEPDLSADIVIEQDDSSPGDPENEVVEVAKARIPPFSHRLFRLGPREVDGSLPGTFNTGTHTALTRAAYRIRSSVPLVAYQFNPLENVGVFSNDASLLKPVEAVTPPGGGLRDAYVVLGWPQTIASTGDPRTNFDANDPIDLRSFLTIVGTQPKTTVRVITTAPVIGGGPVEPTPPGGVIEAELGPFDVLNLESDDFNGDFTGTLVQSDGAVIVFSGNEASDAPYFTTLGRRRCCADHLEEQIDPIRTAGRSFVASVSPNRSRALVAAGATIGVAEQPEYFRIIAVTSRGARVTTTLSGDSAAFELAEQGSYFELSSTETFAVTSDQPVMLASISPSQAAANIPGELPGGDPSLLIVPPLEQFRSSYVFLTPDFYAFDFVRVIASPEARIVLNGRPIDETDGCSQASIAIAPDAPDGPQSARTVAPNWVVITCQLSFPRVDPNATLAADVLSDGIQKDGPQFLVSDRPVGVLVDGFDAFVSYAYAGGTDLEVIVPE